MKKFEELERIQKEWNKENTQNKENEGGDNGGKQDTQAEPQPLTEEQLQEVFKRTSAFTVKSATMDVDGDDMDALELWQIEFQDGNTDEIFEEEYVILPWSSMIHIFTLSFPVIMYMWMMTFGTKSLAKVHGLKEVVVL